MPLTSKDGSCFTCGADRNSTRCPDCLSYRKPEAVADHAQAVPQNTLKALRSRLAAKPAWYRRPDQSDQDWYITSFTHDQMEGNRLACVELIDKALLSTQGVGEQQELGNEALPASTQATVETQTDSTRFTLEDLKADVGKRGMLAGKLVRIWQQDHGGDRWRRAGKGYTREITQAGIYTFEDAWSRSCHCGPEKGIVYELAAPSVVAGVGEHAVGEGDLENKTPVTDVSASDAQGQEVRMMLSLRAADKMAWVCDDWVQRHIIDARSALADARLSYGEPFKYLWSKLEAPSVMSSNENQGADQVSEKPCAVQGEWRVAGCTIDISPSRNVNVVYEDVARTLVDEHNASLKDDKDFQEILAIRRAIAEFVPADENIEERSTLDALNVLFRRIAHGKWRSDSPQASEVVEDKQDLGEK